MKIIEKTILNVLKLVTVVAFILLTILLTASIVARYIPNFSLLWASEIIELLFAYIVFYGAAALWISREHFSAGDWLSRKFIPGERGRHFYRMILEVVSLVFVIVFFYYSWKLFVSTGMTMAVTNVLAMPKQVFYSCLPVSGGIMILFSLRNIVVEVVTAIRAKPAQLVQPDQGQTL